MTESIRTVPQNSFQNTANCKHFSANVRKWGPFRTTEKAHSERRSMWIGFNIAQNATNIQALQGKCTKARSYSHKLVKLWSHRRSMWIGSNNIVQKASHMQALYDKCKKVSTFCTTEKLRSERRSLWTGSNIVQTQPICKHFTANAQKESKEGPFLGIERKSMWIGFCIGQNAPNMQAQ